MARSAVLDQLDGFACAALAVDGSCDADDLCRAAEGLVASYLGGEDFADAAYVLDAGGGCGEAPVGVDFGVSEVGDAAGVDDHGRLADPVAAVFEFVGDVSAVDVEREGGEGLDAIVGGVAVLGGGVCGDGGEDEGGDAVVAPAGQVCLDLRPCEGRAGVDELGLAELAVFVGAFLADAAERDAAAFARPVPSGEEGGGEGAHGVHVDAAGSEGGGHHFCLRLFQVVLNTEVLGGMAPV